MRPGPYLGTPEHDGLGGGRVGEDAIGKRVRVELAAVAIPSRSISPMSVRTRSIS